MKVLFIAALLTLTGCAGQTPDVGTLRVDVPVLVPCHTNTVAEPAFAASGLRKTDPLEVKVRALLAERRQRIGYERELLAGMQACRRVSFRLLPESVNC